MYDDLCLLEGILQFFVSRTEVIDPDGRIGEDHCLPGLRRGMLFNPGIEPPRAANRAALSHSMSALRTSRMSAVFSSPPAYSRAVRKSHGRGQSLFEWSGFVDARHNIK